MGHETIIEITSRTDQPLAADIELRDADDRVFQKTTIPDFLVDSMIKDEAKRTVTFDEEGLNVPVIVTDNRTA